MNGSIRTLRCGSVLRSRLLLESIGTQSDFLGEERQQINEVLAADPLLLYILIQIFERAHPASTMSILLELVAHHITGLQMSQG